MLNSLLSEFGSRKSVGDHIGRVMSTDILGMVPQYPPQGAFPLQSQGARRRTCRTNSSSESFTPLLAPVQTARPEQSSSYHQAKTCNSSTVLKT